MFLAHGVGGRSDLPAPLWLAMYAAGLVVFASFLVLITFWHVPRFRGAAAGRPAPGWLRRTRESAALRLLLGALGLLLFAVTLTVLALGGRTAADNPAPTWIFVWLWVGLPLLSVVFGPIWRPVNPLRTIAAGVRRLLPFRRDYPERLGYLPAAVSLLVFVWLELVYRGSSEPPVLLVVMIAYSVVHIALGAWFGPDWFARGEAFEVYSELMGRFSPVGRRGDGELVLRSPLDGLASLRPSDGLVAVVCVLLGSTAFDGFTRTRFWAGLSNRFSAQPANALLGTAGLLAAIGLVAALYLAATAGRAALRAKVRETTGLRLPALFAHSLLPIVLGYTVAHYFSYFLFQGQAGYLLAADPFGMGWQLFGPPGRRIDYGVISTTAIGVVQVGAIVAGHVAGVISAHDRAMEVFPPRLQLRAQLPLVIAMIVYTFAGIGLVTG